MKRGLGEALATELRAIRGRLRRHGLRAGALALGVTALVVGLERAEFPPLVASERAGYDATVSLFTRRPEKSAHVVVIEVDEASVQWAAERHRRDWGPWPWPRFVWGKLALYLKNGGARAMVVDLVMPDPQQGGFTDQMVEDIHASGLPFFLGFGTTGESVRLPAVTAQNLFAAEVYPATGPGGLEDPGLFALPGDEEDPGAFALSEDGEDPEDLQSPKAEELARALAFPVGGSRAPRVLEARGVAGHPVPPDRALIGTLAGYGLVEPEHDPDGVLRRTFFAYQVGENAHVTLPVAAAADLLGARVLELAPGRMRLGERSWRTSADGSVRIDYGGDPLDMFVNVPFYRAYGEIEQQGDDAVPSQDLFRDKVVLVGGSALALQDIKATPFSPSTPGYAKQAAVLDGLLSGRFIVDAPYWLTLLVTLGVALLSALVLTGLRLAVFELAWLVLLVAGSFLGTGLLLRASQLYVPWAMPLWAGVLSSIGAVALARWVSDRNRELLRKSFERYLDPGLVSRMVESAQLPRLEGETREITAFFSDIKGFSTFSETLKEDPQTLVRVLNTYLTRVSTALLDEGGCLDKYIGDAVVCLFGAPLAQADHAVRACHGALAAQREVAKLRVEFAAQGLPDVYTRIGLNSARMFVGNFGSDQLFDYTAIGDGMNLAARLEGANKAYGSLIMIGPLTWQQAKDHIEARELDRVRVAGKKEAVPVYELLALKGGLDARKQRTVALYAQGLEAFRAARFADGEALFAQALAEDPDDGPSKVLRERCRRFCAEPPEHFDGVADLEK